VREKACCTQASTAQRGMAKWCQRFLDIGVWQEDARWPVVIRRALHSGHGKVVPKVLGYRGMARGSEIACCDKAGTAQQGMANLYPRCRDNKSVAGGER